MSLNSLALIHFNHKLIDGQVGWEPLGSGARNPNYGDMLVCAAVLRQVAPVDPVRAMFGTVLTTPVSSAIVRGSTYLSRRFDYDGACATLDSIDAPIAMVGLGAQSPTDDPAFLDDVPSARRFVEKLAEKSVSISVRGDFTATVLERLGATNLRVTGCPSMFYSLRPPPISVPSTLSIPQRNLGISLHTGLRPGMFCRNAPATRERHVDVLRYALDNGGTAAFFEQGVPAEYAVGNRASSLEERISAAHSIIDRIDGAGRVDPLDLVTRMVSPRSIEEWLMRARDLDALIGFRFHGNMVGLTQGVPCFYYTYDSRLTEFCHVYRLPFQDVEADWEDPVTAILEHDWDDTTRAISDCFDELVKFYEENGIAHTLRREVGDATAGHDRHAPA